MFTRTVKFLPIATPARRLIKQAANIGPSLALKFDTKRRAQLLREFQQCRDVDASIKFTQRYMGTGSCQNVAEISHALDFIAQVKPTVLCEIGTFDSGTSLLFAKFLPTLRAMLCMDLFVKNKQFLRLLSPPSLDVTFLEGSSHSSRMAKSVEHTMAGRKIDVLFIDGDHRYEGVRQDFVTYRPFVRPGGIVLFHDIVQEKPGSKAWAGGVPQFWSEIKTRYEHREIIEDPAQSGFGIGILITDGATPDSRKSEY